MGHVARVLQAGSRFHPLAPPYLEAEDLLKFGAELVRREPDLTLLSTQDWNSRGYLLQCHLGLTDGSKQRGARQSGCKDSTHLAHLRFKGSEPLLEPLLQLCASHDRPPSALGGWPPPVVPG